MLHFIYWYANTYTVYMYIQVSVLTPISYIHIKMIALSVFLDALSVFLEYCINCQLLLVNEFE